jgi:peroxiredoxin
MTMHDDSTPNPDQDPMPPDAGTTPPTAGDAPPIEPRLSRRAAWVAMGSVVLALGLLWAAADLSDPQFGEDGLGIALGEDPEDAEAVGKVAPLDFTLKDMNGVTVKLSSFKGKIILLNFWATWCPPCKVEIPDLIALQDEYADDLVVLGFSVDDTPELLKPFAAEYAINYPLLVGLGHENVQEAYGPMWGIPVTVVIDRDGRVAQKHSGIRTKEQIEREIKALL